MIARVREQIYIKTENRNIVKELKAFLDKPNPEWQKKKAMGYSVHNIPHRIKMYQQWDEGIIIPRGTGRMARELADKYGEPFELQDDRTWSTETIDVDLAPGITPFWYQQAMVEAMTENEQGLDEAPCGAGKTVAGCMFIAEHQRRTLIVVHTLDLFKQWISELGSKLHGRFKIGQIGGGKKFHGDITVATVQTLSKFNAKQWDFVRKHYSICLMDEAHHCGADTYMLLMRNIAARYEIGLTATPNRRDGKNFIVHAYLGRVFHKVTTDDLELSGRLVPCKVMMAKTGAKYNFTEFADQHSTLAAAIAKDIIRNKKIVDRTLMDIEEGFVPLLLTERVYHAKYLVSLLALNHIEVEEISGHVHADERERIKNKLKAGSVQALVANKQIAAEGLDVPPISAVHICFWTPNFGLIKQMIGRGRRVHGDKEYCRVWWHYDHVYEIYFDDEELVTKTRECPGFRSVRRKVAKWFKDQNFSVIDLEPED